MKESADFTSILLWGRGQWGKFWRVRGQSWLHNWINHFTSWAHRNIISLTLGNSEFSILLVRLLLNYLWRHASYFLYSFYFNFFELKHSCWSQFCGGGDNEKERGGGQRSKLIIHVRDKEGSLRSVIKDNCPQWAHLLPRSWFLMPLKRTRIPWRNDCSRTGAGNTRWT